MLRIPGRAGPGQTGPNRTPPDPPRPQTSAQQLEWGGHQPRACALPSQRTAPPNLPFLKRATAALKRATAALKRATAAPQRVPPPRPKSGVYSLSHPRRINYGLFIYLSTYLRIYPRSSAPLVSLFLPLSAHPPPLPSARNPGGAPRPPASFVGFVCRVVRWLFGVCSVFVRYLFGIWLFGGCSAAAAGRGNAAWGAGTKPAPWGALHCSQRAAEPRRGFPPPPPHPWEAEGARTPWVSQCVYYGVCGLQAGGGEQSALLPWVGCTGGAAGIHPPHPATPPPPATVEHPLDLGTSHRHQHVP